MAGNNHGGPREGVQGRGYSNRTDLLANPSRVQPAPEAPAEQTAQPRPNMIPPDMIPTLTAPTNRPEEPVTAGLPTGPGATSPGVIGGPDTTAITLGLLFQATNDPAIGRLLAEHNYQRGSM